MNNLFMKLDNVSGESRDAGHSGWTDIQSSHWGVSRSEAGNKGANHQNLIVHAAVDKSTPTIFLYGSNGNKIRKVEISACKAGAVKIQYWEQGTAGGKGAETRSGWDIKNNTSSF